MRLSHRAFALVQEMHFDMPCTWSKWCGCSTVYQVGRTTVTLDLKPQLEVELGWGDSAVQKAHMDADGFTQAVGALSVGNDVMKLLSFPTVRVKGKPLVCASVASYRPFSKSVSSSCR